ncbi:fumarylacetoacetate hydrolase family protein [Fodinisporobacter ferrooxydans]|uniref:Fumarylacetoacetate hydrolase family protein n=1 Tax=Fodinisporobacter ferrooxydans TaxID=2901836 RepID=A0ABY4CHE5_9BACL|nr:fumarylacetoacetate hydrolase family protein [Alicyclobacillaceae bacterium MYW30-H2]
MEQGYQSFSNVKNIYCVGRNFGLHAKELGNAIPEQPMIFTKPTHAIAQADGTIPFFKTLGEIHHEVEIVLWVCRTYQPGMRLQELVNAFTIGIDFTARDIQSVLKAKGHPWVLSKGFPNSAVLAPFRPVDDATSLQSVSFGLRKNGVVVQHGTPAEMIFDFQTILDYIGTNLGLSEGDIIFTGTPAGVGPIADQEVLELLLNEEGIGKCQVSLA